MMDPLSYRFVVEHPLMDPLSYFSFQSALHDWGNKGPKWTVIYIILVKLLFQLR